MRQPQQQPSRLLACFYGPRVLYGDQRHAAEKRQSPGANEVMVNGPDDVYVERKGADFCEGLEQNSAIRLGLMRCLPRRCKRT
jgi:hypothetical protein